MFFNWFKYKVPVEQHSEEVISRMMKDFEPGWLAHKSCFWGYLKQEFGVKQYFNWRNCTNYMVFDDKEHYMMFLLKL
jgi:hypothetical protein